MTSYTTEQGDMWDSIAHKLYGNADRMDVLIAANPELREIYIFSAGVELNVPDIETNETSSGLPSWKQASG